MEHTVNDLLALQAVKQEVSPIPPSADLFVFPPWTVLVEFPHTVVQQRPTSTPTTTATTAIISTATTTHHPQLQTLTTPLPNPPPVTCKGRRKPTVTTRQCYTSRCVCQGESSTTDTWGYTWWPPSRIPTSTCPASTRISDGYKRRVSNTTAST